MMTQEAVQATIFATSHPDLAKRTSIAGMFLSALMTLVGVGLLVSVFQLEDSSSTISMLLMVAGTILLLFGLFRLFWKSRKMVYIPTGSATKSHSLFFDTKYLTDLKSVFESGHFSTDRLVKSGESGNIRVDMLLSQDGKFAAVQLFQFVPYNYEPVTSVIYYVGEQASALTAYVQQCKPK